MGIRAGLLRDIVTFQAPVITRDAFGEQSTQWVDHLTTRARVIFNGGTKAERNNEVYNSFNVTFVVRCYHDINDKMHIVYKGRKYNIESLNEDTQAQQTTLVCTVINE